MPAGAAGEPPPPPGDGRRRHRLGRRGLQRKADRPRPREPVRPGDKVQPQVHRLAVAVDLRGGHRRIGDPVAVVVGREADAPLGPADEHVGHERAEHLAAGQVDRVPDLPGAGGHAAGIVVPQERRHRMEEPGLGCLERDHELHAIDLGGGGGEREGELRVAVIVVGKGGRALEAAGLPGRGALHAGRRDGRDRRRRTGGRDRLAAGRRLEADRPGEEWAALARDLPPESGRAMLVGAEHARDPGCGFVDGERLEGRDHDVVEPELLLLPGKGLPVEPAIEPDRGSLALERAFHEVQGCRQVRRLQVLAGGRHRKGARPFGERPGVSLAAQGDRPAGHALRRLGQKESQQVMRGEDRVAEVDPLRTGVGQRRRLRNGHVLDLQLGLPTVGGRDEHEVRDAEERPQHPGMAGHGHLAGRHLLAVDAVEQIARADLHVGRLPVGRGHVAAAIHDAEIDRRGKIRAKRPLRGGHGPVAAGRSDHGQAIERRGKLRDRRPAREPLAVPGGPG